jgi:ribosome-binding protein aMBF1 (putative translation factor)
MSTLPAVPRPKAERPKRTLIKPDLAAGQAARLRQAREAKGWSLRDLVAASGVSVRTIHAIEDGKGSGASTCVTMASLADALGVSRGWLAFGG